MSRGPSGYSHAPCGHDPTARRKAHAGAVGLTADLDGRLQLKQHRLVHEDLARAGAEAADVSLRQVDLLARPTAAHLQKLGNHLVNVRCSPCCCCARGGRHRTAGPREPGARCEASAADHSRSRSYAGVWCAHSLRAAEAACASAGAESPAFSLAPRAAISSGRAGRAHVRRV